MKKKSFVCLLVIALLCALCACGGPTPQTEEAGEPENSAQTGNGQQAGRGNQAGEGDEESSVRIQRASDEKTAGDPPAGNQKPDFDRIL